MNVEATITNSTPQLPTGRVAEQVGEARKDKEGTSQDSQAAAKQVQPEELLSQIKALTEDGLYSVRFENDERADGLIVKIVDRENDELIRQVPAEEILDLRAALEDLRGNFVNTQS